MANKRSSKKTKNDSISRKEIDMLNNDIFNDANISSNAKDVEVIKAKAPPTTIASNNQESQGTLNLNNKGSAALSPIAARSLIAPTEIGEMHTSPNLQMDSINLTSGQ